MPFCCWYVNIALLAFSNGDVGRKNMQVLTFTGKKEARVSSCLPAPTTPSVSAPTNRLVSGEVFQ